MCGARTPFSSYEFRTRVAFGRHLDGLFGLGAFGALTPFVALEIAELRSSGFTEGSVSGPGLFRLNVQGQAAASVPAYVGARFQRVTPLGNGMVFSPTSQVAYVHEVAPYRNQTGQIANLPGSVFLVDGARPARDAAQVKAGGELAFSPHAAVFANFDGEFSGVNQLYAGKGSFRYLSSFVSSRQPSRRASLCLSPSPFWLRRRLTLRGAPLGGTQALPTPWPITMGRHCRLKVFIETCRTHSRPHPSRLRLSAWPTSALAPRDL